ncbi:Glucose/arabinose dehydrogenase, beta-propeller fold [Gordonia westfalica]|uniref:Glucose/arabinose dehydrogenase, beta-propeller fold n=2 Tax=Gordonia westfalica TaxID=158898 RepID=A0A1H2JIW6_9ACTN|nr:Glucose/arabinose dehydrogenase, beta-propeller fold [Gordonia westfalica]
MARMHRRDFLAAVALGGLGVVAACAPDSSSRTTGTPTSDPSAPGMPAPSTGTATTVDPTRITTVASGLNVPWAFAFLRDGSALVTQRDDATVVRVVPGRPVTTVGDVADAAPRGEGGLQGIALAPGDESAVYLYYTTDHDNRLIRMEFDGDRLTDPRPLLTGLDFASNHHGGALLFDSTGHLFVAVGDAAEPDVAQDVRSLNGKILRVDRDGRAAAGNPFGNEVWSYGHRNIEGLAFDSANRLWATEFGQNGQDELNLIRRGGNYGWPTVEGESDDPRFVAPQATWSTSEASPAGLAILGDRAYMAALRGRRLWEIPLAGESAGRPVDVLADTFGRLRAVAVAPDGALWLGTSNTDGRGRPVEGDDRILRVPLAAT